VRGPTASTTPARGLASPLRARSGTAQTGSHPLPLLVRYRVGGRGPQGLDPLLRGSQSSSVGRRLRPGKVHYLILTGYGRRRSASLVQDQVPGAPSRSTTTLSSPAWFEADGWPSSSARPYRAASGAKAGLHGQGARGHLPGSPQERHVTLDSARRSLPTLPRRLARDPSFRTPRAEPEERPDALPRPVRGAPRREEFDHVAPSRTGMLTGLLLCASRRLAPSARIPRDLRLGALRSGIELTSPPASIRRGYLTVAVPADEPAFAFPRSRGKRPTRLAPRQVWFPLDPAKLDLALRPRGRTYSPRRQT